MKVIVAIDSFKGCLTSTQANLAAEEGVKSACPAAEVVQLPVSDGGEGFVHACHKALMEMKSEKGKMKNEGGTIESEKLKVNNEKCKEESEEGKIINERDIIENDGCFVEVTVNDPLMRPVRAKYLLQDRRAVIEIAQASGLTLLKREERNPLAATSYGTGQLVADAVRRGAKDIIVGLGGSATSDAGQGMLEALIDAFSNNGQWNGIEELKDVRFTIATDVRNPLCGPEGAAHVFAPQKGATPDQVLILDERARVFAERSARIFGYDRSVQPGAGAAGGLGYAFLQYLNAECRSGVELLLEMYDFMEKVRDADLIITGEGSADRQTLMGKLPKGILEQSGGVPVWLLAGRIKDKEALLGAGFSRVECINAPGTPLAEALRPEVAMEGIKRTIFGRFREKGV